jgi:hypothetical protein
MLDVALLLRTASHARPVLSSVGVAYEVADVLFGSTRLEGRLAPLEVASVVLGTEEGEDDDVRGNDTDEDTLDEGVVGYDLATGRCLNRSGVLITTGCRK